MKPLYFATSNKQKVAEARDILKLPIEEASLELDEIQSLNLEEIVVHKARQAYEQLKKPVFVDDVGFDVNAWNGFPGPFIKFLLEAGGNEMILNMMSGFDNKKVTTICSIEFHDGSQVHVFQGFVEGELVNKPRGHGWGFEPIFKPLDSDMTWAEMSEDMKNTLSHRFRALEKFKEYLRERGVYTA